MSTRANTPYDKLQIGQEAELTRKVTTEDLLIFAHASGNLNPMHMPDKDGDGDGTPDGYAPSMWVASLISSVLGNRLPGPGTLYKSQTLEWHGRAVSGDVLTIRAKLLAKGEGRLARFATSVLKDGNPICSGEAEVYAPERQLSFEDDDVPGLLVQSHVHFDRILERAAPLDPIPTSVVAPEEPKALAGALLAMKHTIITPILIGSLQKIIATAEEIGASLDGVEIIDIPDHGAAAAEGVRLVHEGRARAVMKGHLHTDELLRHVIKREGGLRTGRRLSHVFVMDVPGLKHLLMVTDAAINIAPTLEEKVDIIQNAIDLAQSLGIDQPKVGVLSAVETVNPNIPSTLDAAILSKMAERGQIKGGIVDGPLAMDNAMDLDAARTKGITSAVAGRAEILAVPNLEAGNMLAKQLTFVAHAEAAGIVMGAQVPVILTSRADDDKARLASCAVAALYANRPR